MPLNYNKWDKLELSDDSDIEEHPNIDKRSMINWKKRDIHEKRQARNSRIAHFQAEIDLNNILLPRLISLRERITSTSQGRQAFNQEVERLRTQPSDEKPPTGHEEQPTYDALLLNLLDHVQATIKDEISSLSSNSSLSDSERDEKVVKILGKALEKHEEELRERSVELGREKEREERERGGKITSEDIREGWSGSSVQKVTASPWEEEELKKKAAAAKKPESTPTSTSTSIEVLNSPSPSSTSKPTSTPDPDDQEEQNEDGPAPTLTPLARRFSQIPLKAYEKSYTFIANDPAILVESTTDALLGEAFELELKGDKGGAKRCVHQGLLVQYCRKLGRDGVKLFFQRMQQGGPKAEQVFQSDVDSTYERLSTRCAQIKQEQASAPEKETIQLVSEDPNTTISFNIPDGPPPANLTLEGEGTEELDPEEVKKFLQMKWEYFESFPKDLREAMGGERLEGVNKVLERMELGEAEEVVRKMQEGGMLSFSESGIRDMTKQ